MGRYYYKLNIKISIKDIILVKTGLLTINSTHSFIFLPLFFFLRGNTGDNWYSVNSRRHLRFRLITVSCHISLSYRTLWISHFIYIRTEIREKFGKGVQDSPNAYQEQSEKVTRDFPLSNFVPRWLQEGGFTMWEFL